MIGSIKNPVYLTNFSINASDQKFKEKTECLSFPFLHHGLREEDQRINLTFTIRFKLLITYKINRTKRKFTKFFIIISMTLMDDFAMILAQSEYPVCRYTST
jgi:hypothetical protein